MRSREEDEDSDVASHRKPGHSHKKARLAALPAKQKAWNRDLALRGVASIRTMFRDVMQQAAWKK